MYLATSRSADAAADVVRAPLGSRVPANVIALGTVSLVTDISSEMVTAVLPVFLFVGLGLSPFAIGVVSGVYAGATVLLRLVGAAAADRTRRRKLVAGLGYGTSALARLLLLLAGSSLGLIGTALGLDRVGKGLRTAPRDALISLSSEPASLGSAFGLHRAMDTVGGLVGPLLAFLILWRLPDRYDAVWVVSFCVAALGVVVLVLFVRDHHETGAGGVTTTDPPARWTLRPVLALARQPDLRRVWICASLLAATAIGDSFVYLLLQRELDLGLSRFALLPLGTAAVFLTLAVPLGRLADRVGRWRMFLLGYGALAVVYVLLWSSLDGPGLVIGVLVAYGFHYAATDGVLMAVASQHIPGPVRTSGLALVQTATAAAGLVAAVLFGAGWTLLGPPTTLLAFALALAVGVAGAARFGPGTGPGPEVVA